MKIIDLTWDLIYPIWRDRLWPNRVSPIEPASAIKYLGGIDMDNTLHQPCLFGMEVDDTIVGVNSVIECADGGYRSRGLWVNPDYRKQQIAKKLLEHAIDIARSNSAYYIWSMPRQSAWPAYRSAGFIQSSDWFDKDVEFGPNCFVRKDL